MKLIVAAQQKVGTGETFKSIMPRENNDDHETTRKIAGNDIPELVEPEALNVVIDGHTSPDDFLDEGRRKQWLYRVLVAMSAFVVISVTLSVSLGLTGRDSRPTQPPSSAPTSSVVTEFMNSFPSYSMELAKNDSDSAQTRALTWLQGDPLYNEYELYRLYQRYALAVLYYATDGAYWNSNRGWMSNASECSWYTALNGDICGKSSRLLKLNLDSNRLDGSIPTELELLTDLEYMGLWDDTLSGTIHSVL
jgi:hypothetical protein